jgi:predicted regulator of amino acid metabolism with ACT domain
VCFKSKTIQINRHSVDQTIDPTESNTPLNTKINDFKPKYVQLLVLTTNLTYNEIINVTVYNNNNGGEFLPLQGHRLRVIRYEINVETTA